MFDTEDEKLINKRVEAFEGVVLGHEKFTQVMNRVRFHLSSPASVQIVVLVGPTGIGKSLMMGHILKKLNEMRSRRPDEPDFRPVAHTIAMASGYRQFDFKTLYRDGLKNLGDPVFDRRDTIDRVYLRSLRLDTTASLRVRMQEEMYARNTYYWLVDEAQHLIFGGRSGTTGDQFDVLKSISQMTNCVFLIAGPCMMDAELARSAQLVRRIVSVPFDRYHHDRPDDLAEFGSVANQLLSRMDLHKKPEAEQILTLLYDGSAGCVGILKDWLTRSYAMALKESADPEGAVLTEEILRAMRLSAVNMETVMTDIRRLDYATKRNSSDDVYSDIVRGQASVQPDIPDDKPKDAPAAKRKVPVGVRKATRDPLVAPGM